MWTSAFLRYIAIYTEKYPGEIQQLLKYCEIIRDLAKRKLGMAWSIYDQNFRLLRESKVVLPGRTFLRRLYDLTKKVSNPYHRVTFKKESRRDIDAWKMFVEHFNGKHLLLEQRWISSDSLHFYTDAAGSIGFGAVFNTHWFHGLWPEHLKRFPITFKELFPIVLALEIWGENLKNKCVTLHSDNYAVVHIINRQTSKDPDIMVLVRRLVLTCMRLNLLVRSIHILGVQNLLPDLLSRSQIAEFRALAKDMDPEPTDVPLQLLLQS